MSDALEHLARAHAVLRGSLPSDDDAAARRAHARALAGHRMIRGFLIRQLWHSLRSIGLEHGHQSIAALRRLARAPVGSPPGPETSGETGWLAGIVPEPQVYRALAAELEADGGERSTARIAALGDPTSDPARLHADAVHTTIGLLVESMLCVVHGTVNARVSSRADDESIRSLSARVSTQAIARRDALTRALRDTVDRWSREHDAMLRQAYAATVARPTDAVATVLAPLDALLERLPAMAEVHNGMDGLMRALLDDGKRSAGEAIGRQLARLGALTRHTIGAAAGLARLGVDLHLDGRGDPDRARTRERITRAAQTPFDLPQLPNGRNTAIHRLDDAADGDFVEIEGIVREPRALRTSKGALIWRAKLFDPSSRAEVEIATLYTHLGHLGLDEGCFAAINGHVEDASNLLGGRRGIVIDRLALAELQRDSWKLALYDAAKPYYQVHYNGTNARWSLGPHAHDHAKAEITRCGACELMFQPLWASPAYRAARRRKYAGEG